jgi:hypothetical protein
MHRTWPSLEGIKIGLNMKPEYRLVIFRRYFLFHKMLKKETFSRLLICKIHEKEGIDEFFETNPQKWEIKECMYIHPKKTGIYLVCFNLKMWNWFNFSLKLYSIVHSTCCFQQHRRHVPWIRSAISDSRAAVA